MIATFNETLRSLQDKTYGHVIITRSIPSVLWYWTKYLLFFTATSFFLIVAGFTYLVPQLPRLIKDRIPKGEMGLKQGKFYSSSHKPVVFGRPEFSVILNPTGTVSDLDHFQSGVLVLSDQVVFKSGPDQIDSRSLSVVKNFSLSTDSVLDWTTHNQSRLWVILLIATFTVSLLSLSLYWSYKISFLLFWTFVFWVLAKLLKKETSLKNIFKLCIYAAVPSLFVSLILVLAPNQVLSYLSLGLFVYFTLSWLWNLPAGRQVKE